VRANSSLGSLSSPQRYSLLQDDGSIIFEAEVAGMDEIKFWIMNWGSHALVIEPESLRDEIVAEAEAMLGKYTKGIKKGERPLRA